MYKLLWGNINIAQAAIYHGVRWLWHAGSSRWVSQRYYK